MPSPQQLIIQPSFDKRIRTYPTPLGVPVSVERGFMVWDIPGGGLGYSGGSLGGRDKINFLFNPSTISSSFGVANASLQAAMLYPVPGSTGNLMAPLTGQSVSWDLYFDRSYELNYGTGAGGNGTGQPNDPGVIGCQADVMQFMQFTGMLANLSQATGNSVNILTGSAAPTGAVQGALGNGGIMVMMPCWVFFSNLTQAVALNATQANSPQALNSQLKYYGYINNWAVNYTHWTEQMVPIRCVISVTFTMLPDPSQANYVAIAEATGNVGYNLTGPVYPTPNGKAGSPSLSQLLTSSGGRAGR